MNMITSIEGSVERQPVQVSAKRWITGTFAGWTVGFVLAILCIIGVESIGIRETQFPLALGMGLSLGYEQSRLLKPVLQNRWRWFWATSLGLTAPFIFMDVVRVLELPIPYSLAALVAIGGVSVSVLQWLQLRSVSPRASGWLAASPVGWVLAGSTVWLADQLPRIPGLVGALVFVAVVLGGGVLLGACTAPVLLRISRGENA
jgi:hypothetical protein